MNWKQKLGWEEIEGAEGKEGKRKRGGGREGIIHSLFIYNMNSARKCAGC